MQKETPLSPENYKCIGHDEIHIRAILDDQLEALRVLDTETVQSYYTDDIVAFDLQPPLQFTGKDHYRQAWKMMDSFTAPIKYERQKLELVVGEDVAFGHCLEHFLGTTRGGEEVDCWMRHSFGLQKIEGHWKIAHESFSVPIGEDGKGLFNLKP